MTDLFNAPDGRRALTQAWNDQSRLIDMEAGQPMIPIPLGVALRAKLTPSCDWEMLVVADRGAIELYPAPSILASPAP